MLEDLKSKVRRLNQELPKRGLVYLTFGNASAFDPKAQRVIIKPSGVDFDSLIDRDMVVVDLNGNKLEGDKKPSSDLPTHVELYKCFPEIGAIVHTHSQYATSFAQARKPICCYGTTHADHFHGVIPVTCDLNQEEIERDYELNTGKAIVRALREQGIKALEVPACLVASHGPFVWGASAEEALENAIALEEIAKMNLNVLLLNPKIQQIGQNLLDKHFYRKHGETAYYGQEK